MGGREENIGLGCHPQRAEQRSRATAQDRASPNMTWEFGSNESGVKRALVELHEWPYGRVDRVVPVI